MRQSAAGRRRRRAREHAAREEIQACARVRARGGDDARAGGVRARGEWFKLSNELERCAPAAAAAVHDEDVAAAVLDADGASASTDGAGGDARGGVRDGGRDERSEDGAAASSSGRGGGGDGESGRAVRGQDVEKSESGEIIDRCQEIERGAAAETASAQGAEATAGGAADEDAFEERRWRCAHGEEGETAETRIIYR